VTGGRLSSPITDINLEMILECTGIIVAYCGSYNGVSECILLNQIIRINAIESLEVNI